MKTLLLCILCLLSACAVSSTPIDTKPSLNLPTAEPVKMRSVKLHVIHLAIAKQKFKEIEDSGQAPVVFALTGTDYKNLAINIQRLKRYIKTQQKIIDAYKKYYEGLQNDKDKN